MNKQMIGFSIAIALALGAALAAVICRYEMVVGNAGGGNQSVGAVYRIDHWTGDVVAFVGFRGQRVVIEQPIDQSTVVPDLPLDSKAQFDPRTAVPVESTKKQ